MMFDLEFPVAHGERLSRATLKQTPSDFVVEEILGFEPSGGGEHLYIHVRKRNRNTAEIEADIARIAGVARRQVSCSGLKDRLAVTSQWFSVHLPGCADPDLTGLATGGTEILATARHHRKLRRGTHKANRFQLRLTRLEGDSDDLGHRLQRVRDAGFPNYFGRQRFGHGASNLVAAASVTGKRGRQQRAYTLSAARSWLFNRVLASRVTDGSWNQLLAGDVASLAGSSSVFAVPSVTGELSRRCATLDIHPSGPMWGRGELMSSGEVAKLEQDVTGQYPVFRELVESAGMKQERRALRCLPAEMEWHVAGDNVQLCFVLPRGSYATALVDELVETVQRAD